MFVSLFLKQKKYCSFRVSPTLGCHHSTLCPSSDFDGDGINLVTPANRSIFFASMEATEECARTWRRNPREGDSGCCGVRGCMLLGFLKILFWANSGC
ncbi:hypothetical protein E1A91_D05G428000v1 [Gossypium mustelinum]|uniref:Uncharacterized protein n=1 Tax=Gossypium mustelinum TaxID=34275 RepID=A0A5D2V7J1_GOSMU|nr:hypothetical protein E1A91_D05G428000v1 [Gossypium mustelinum]